MSPERVTNGRAVADRSCPRGWVPAGAPQQIGEMLAGRSLNRLKRDRRSLLVYEPKTSPQSFRIKPTFLIKDGVGETPEFIQYSPASTSDFRLINPDGGFVIKTYGYIPNQTIELVETKGGFRRVLLLVWNNKTGKFINYWDTGKPGVGLSKLLHVGNSVLIPVVIEGEGAVALVQKKDLRGGDQIGMLSRMTLPPKYLETESAGK